MKEEINNQDVMDQLAGVGEETSVSGSETVDPALEALTAERDDLQDRLLRKQAEFENFRKRIDRERSEFMKFASAELMREVLNVLDSFELALREAASEKEDSGDVRQGLELIHKQLLDSLKRFGLEEVEAEGQPFDPHVHEAVNTQPSDQPEETVLHELRKGYVLHGKLLRPAMVTVAAPAGGTDG